MNTYRIYKFPDNNLNFTNIEITSVSICLNKNNTNTDWIMISKDEDDICIIDYKNGEKKKILYQITHNKFDSSRILNYCKNLNVKVYRFPENNIEIKYIAIKDYCISLFHKSGYYFIDMFKDNNMIDVVNIDRFL